MSAALTFFAASARAGALHDLSGTAAPAALPEVNPKSVEEVQTATKDIAKVLADRVGCLESPNGDNNKPETVKWYVAQALASYEKFVRRKLGSQEGAQNFVSFDAQDWSDAFVARLKIRVNNAILDKKTTDALVMSLSDNIRSLFDKLPVKRENKLTARNYFSLYKGSKLPSAALEFGKRNMKALGLNCDSFVRLDNQWISPHFASDGHIVEMAKETKADQRHRAKNNAAAEAAVAAGPTRPVFSRERASTPTPSLPLTDQEKATAERLHKESATIDPRAAVQVRENPKFFGLIKNRQVAKGADGNGHMPNVLYIPTAGGGHHAPLKPVYIITHMTAGRTSGPTSAHFTVHRDGTVTQQGPITQQMPAAKCNNNLAVHVEFEAKYNGWERDSRGHRYSHTYEPLTDAQLAAGAKVYAYISRATGIPLNYLGNGESPDLRVRGQSVGKVLALHGVPQTRDRGVVNHREVLCSLKEGVHHDDFLAMPQMNQLLGMARHQ